MATEATRPDFAGGKIGWSLSRLASEFGIARETVAKRLSQAGVEPVGERNGYATYALRSAAAAILEIEVADSNDPASMAPDKRNAWYQSEMRRMEVEMRARTLVPASEVEAEISDLVKAWVQFLDTLADQLERDVGLTPEQVDGLNEAIGKQRAAAQQLMAGKTEDDARLCS